MSASVTIVFNENSMMLLAAAAKLRGERSPPDAKHPLQRPRATRLIQRPTLSIALIQGESGLPKQLITKIGIYVAKVGTVEGVERIRSQLQVETVVEVYVFPHRQ